MSLLKLVGHKERKMGKQNYDIAAYVWPAYTGDDIRARIFWQEGIGEWQSVKNSISKFEGHTWPRKPLWGYVNEADPYIMEMEINAAADHGVNVFIYDWYWYDHGPFLENCLNDGYLRAKNNDRVKFYIMWANHSVNHTWDIRNSHLQSPHIWEGIVDRNEFEVVGRRLIEKYFKHPSYYMIEDKPVLMLYDLKNLVRGLGSVNETQKALNWLKDECIRSGLKGLHLQCVLWGNLSNLSGVDSGERFTNSSIIEELGFDSVTHYQFVHFTSIDRDYNEIMMEVIEKWSILDNEFTIPYFPHVSIGWDNNPRFKEFKSGIVKNNTPENVERAFQAAKKYIDSRPHILPLITVNSWNEWTESSYLEPDDLYGYKYLEAIKKTFL